MDNSVKSVKYDKNKERWDLLPLDGIIEAVKIMTFGAEKYGENTWQSLDNGENRYFSALMRHIVAWRLGEKVDIESGISHLAHALVNLLFLIWLEKGE